MLRCLLLLSLLSIASAGFSPRAPASVFRVRGGETEVDVTDSSAERAWLFAQIKALQLKLAFLSDALQRDGVNTTHFESREPVIKSDPVPVVWQLSLKKEDDGKHCLLYGDTEEGAVMVAPKGSDKWVTLHELNRVRRDGVDGARQVSDLWYGQYAMRYEQLMGRLPWAGIATAVVLNHRHGVKALMLGTILAFFWTFYSVLEAVAIKILTSGFVWKRYHIWAKFHYWPLAMKLVVYRQLFVYLWRGFTSVEKRIQDALVDRECEMLEECNRDAIREAEGYHEDDTEEEDYEDEDDDE